MARDRDAVRIVQLTLESTFDLVLIYGRPDDVDRCHLEFRVRHVMKGLACIHDFPLLAPLCESSVRTFILRIGCDVRSAAALAPAFVDQPFDGGSEGFLHHIVESTLQNFQGVQRTGFGTPHDEPCTEQADE